MKRLITLCLMILLAFTLVPATFADSPAPAVFIDGTRMEFEVDPVVIDGSTLVPLRAIFEELGANIEWNYGTRTVTAVKENMTIVYTLGKSTAKRNNDILTLSTPGQVVDGRTLVPLRFVSEALGSMVGWESKSRTITISSANKFPAKVIRVIDGDTVEIEYDGLDGKVTDRLRLIGVDTPETVHPTKSVEPYGKEASDFTTNALTNRHVMIEKDIAERDNYGRLLAYIYLESGSMFNAMLTVDGYAQPLTIPPSDRWTELFTHLSADARSNDRGLWKISDEGPTSTGTTGKVVIVSVDAFAEIVIIRNDDTKDVNMTGWKLVSVTDNQTFDFPDRFVLKPQQSVSIVSGKNAAAGEGKLLWSTSNLWNNEIEDPAQLYDQTHNKVSELN